MQKLTREGGRGTESETAFDEEDWTRARPSPIPSRITSCSIPMLPADRLLYRLFHEENVRAYRAVELETYCSCSRDGVEAMLKGFARGLADMTVDGEVCVTCEFCNSRYRFDPASFADTSINGSSCPDLIRASMPLPVDELKRNGMDCRVKPGNDGL